MKEIGSGRFEACPSFPDGKRQKEDPIGTAFFGFPGSIDVQFGISGMRFSER
jgi:hypothetical protein